MTTQRQKDAVILCENMLNIKFNGDINNSKQVSLFLKYYLEDAKSLYYELEAEYYSYKLERLFA